MKNKAMKIFVPMGLLVLAALFWSTSNNGTPESGSIRVGVITPLTGQYAFIGETNRNAILLAKEQLGSQLGSKNIELFFEDDKYDAKLAVTAYKKLRAINNIDAVIVLSAPSIQTLKPLTDEDNIPLLGLGGTLVYEKDTVFQIMPSGNLIFKTLGNIYGEKNKNIVVAHSSATLFTENARMFVSGLSADVNFEDIVMSSSGDLRTEVEKIVRLNPDAVTVFLPKDDAIKFLKALRISDRGGKIKVVCDFGTEIAVKDYTEAIGKDRLEGCLSTNLGNTTQKKFHDDYMTKYGIEPAITADFAYDSYQLIVELLKSTPKEKWVEKISAKGFSYIGNASGKIEFNEDGTREDMAPIIRQYKDGKFVEVR